MADKPNKLTEKFIFLGEGAADNALLHKLCEKRGLPAFDYPFPDNLRDKKGKTIGGKDRFGEMLLDLEPVISQQRRPRGILIAVDCGDDWEKSFKHVAEQVVGTEFYPRPQRPLEPVSANTEQFPHLPSLVIVMVPGVGRTGGMETLCVEVSRDKHPETAACLEGYLACLKDKSVGISGWGAEKQGKAEMQCLIATTHQDDPNKSGRFAIAAGLIDCSHAAFNTLADDLRAAVKALSGG